MRLSLRFRNLETIMRRIRALITLPVVCMLAGLFGGLALGYVLSRDGGWLTPGPWVVYTVLLVCAVAMLSLVDERRRLRVAEEEWPLPPGYRPPVIEAPADDVAVPSLNGQEQESAVEAAADEEPQAVKVAPKRRRSRAGRPRVVERGRDGE